MLRTRIRDDPNCLSGLDSHQVREKLSKVVVIAFLQLVLDNNCATILVFGNKVDAERASSLFPLDTAESKTRSFGEDIDVLLQPSRKVESLVTPHLAQSYALNAPNH